MVQNDSFIEFNRVSFGYGDRLILQDISLKIGRGQLVAIMGGSGSGKTTLLRLIAGQIRAQQGQVLVDGRDVGRMNQRELYQHRRRMGMLFQFGALFTDLPVFDNVAFPIREHTSLSPEMVRDLVLMKLHAVGLRGTEALMPAELSGGMSRRVALARAIALDPQIMLYDEPFTGLDPISLATIALLIKKLSDALGTSAVMVTHDVHKSLEIVDYVYFIAGGKIAAAGTPDEVRASDSPWVHQFVHGEADGPVHFAYPAQQSLAGSFGLEGA
ncbi:toluene ABC transporter ATP-binding protein [Vogesella sp. EB]|uniref:ABC transporter ATP-binding protein n=1 Tax=Vogesella TaxID=57739 RepID=UPI00064CE390|nr:MULTISPECIES: ABC transporter ATP-binding protein [Vogesella]KMJ53539.1 toluene ABC transporter ATP-binding protein [Vogesella sp. EB]MCQ4143689.1 ABC transporter ATP-binding protein [Vogesella sp. AC12]MDC7697690.1 ABC transporter ATP-binding protein [Vogesella indigofera]